MTGVIKRLAGEILVLAVAIAVTVGAAQVVGPGDFPEAGSAAERQRFYNHLFLATLVPLPAGIIAYYLLRKRTAALEVAAGALGDDALDAPLRQKGLGRSIIRFIFRHGGQKSAPAPR